MNLELVERHNIVCSLISLWKDSVDFFLKEITGNDISINVRVVGESKSRDHSIEAEFITFVLEYLPAGYKILIDIPMVFLFDFLGELLPGGKRESITAQELAFVEYIFLKILFKNQRSSILSNVKFLGCDIENLSMEEPLSFLFRFRFCEQEYSGRLHIEKAFGLKIIELSKEETDGQLNSDVPVTLVLQILEGEVIAGELKNLHPGCLIAFPDSNIRINDDGSIGGVIKLKTIDDEIFARYDIDTDELIVNNSEEVNACQKSLAGKELTESIPVTLSIELKRIRTTIGELRGLKPGHLLKSEIKNQEYVIISANGKIIGRGKLIKIDGTVCVEVLSLEG